MGAVEFFDFFVLFCFRMVLIGWMNKWMMGALMGFSVGQFLCLLLNLLYSMIFSFRLVMVGVT